MIQRSQQRQQAEPHGMAVLPVVVFAYIFLRRRQLDSPRFGRLVNEASFRAALFAQVSVHRLRHMFGVVDDLNDVARAEDDVTA